MEAGCLKAEDIFMVTESSKKIEISRQSYSKPQTSATIKHPITYLMLPTGG